MNNSLLSKNSDWHRLARHTGIWVAAVLLSLVCSAAHAAPLAAFTSEGDVGVGHKALVSEFVITGTQPKTVLVRAIAPSAGLTLADPTLQLLADNGALIEENCDWKTKGCGAGPSQQAEIEATGLSPTDDRESAILRALSPGRYTVVLRGTPDTSGAATTGSASNQVFDMEESNGSIVAAGARGDLVGGALTGVIFLSEPRNVVVRALGPSLGQGSRAISGAIADPVLTVRDPNGAVKLSVDDWQEAAASLAGTGLEPSHPSEAAGMVELGAGTYIANVTGKEADGIAFIQFYALPYNTPLEPAPEIGEPYESTNVSCVSPPAGLAAWFRGDSSGNDFQGGNAGHLQGNANAEAPAKIGTGFGLDGNGDYVEVSNEQAIKPQHLTVNAWVKFDSLESAQINAPAGHQYLVTKHNSRQNGSGFEEAYALVKVRRGGSDVFNFVLTTADRTRVGIDSTTAIQAGQFYHVAGTFDGQTARLYINGVLEASAPANLTLDYSSRSLYLGSSGIPFFDGYFNGVLDEVQIYNRALAESEIQSIVNAGSAGVCKVTPGLWIAGRDLEAHETPDNAAETNAQNSVVPEWSYGYRDRAAGTALTLFSPARHGNRSDGGQGWGHESGLTVVVNTSSTPITPNYGFGNLRPQLPSQLHLHPANSLEFPVLRWTAPEAGYYRVFAEWLDMDPYGGNGASGHVVVNGTEVFGRKVGPDQFGPERFVGQEWDNGGNAEMPAQTFKLNAGDVVDFALGARGAFDFDSTTFNAIVRRVPGVEITNAPPQARTEEGVRLPEGTDITLEVQVDSVEPVREVTLLVNGTQGATDTTAPYSLTQTNLQPGVVYYFSVKATDVKGVESVSEQIKVVAERIPPAAAARRHSNEAEASSQGAAVSTRGRTYYSTQSGAWEDAATWGGAGVPGRNDDAMITLGVGITTTDYIEVQNLSVAGGLLIGSPNNPRSVTVYGTLEVHGAVQGGDRSSLLAVFSRSNFVGGHATLRNLIVALSGQTIVTGNGGIGGSDTTLEIAGQAKVFSPPGTNRPTRVAANEITLRGAQLGIGSYGQVFAPAGVISTDGAGVISTDGAGLIGTDGATVISTDGAGLIGTDGASILGIRGTPLIGTDGSTLIGTDGSTLIGTDGSTLIGTDGATATSDSGGGRRSVYSRRESPGTVTPHAATDADILLESGTISGNINLIGHVVNRGGFISPGKSAGRVTVKGNYTQESAGTLVMEVGGIETSPLQFDQLQISGTATLGGNLIVKTIDGFTPQMGDTFSPLAYNSVSGSFATVTSNAEISFGPDGMTMQVSGPNPPAPKALNIATRMRVETGDNVLIAGFIVTGSQPKKVLVRGVGPSLPVSGALTDPTLDLDAGAFFNDDWRSDQQGEIEATTIPPPSDAESAIVATLEPGAHTAVLRGKSDGTGVGLVEVYDLESGAPAQLANISTRGQVQTGDNVMIGGFIIGGDYPAKVLLRAIGPSLPIEGALQDPTLELVDGQGNTISNDNWRATQEAEIVATTVPPTNDNEAAIVATLVPGAYTAVVRGKDDAVGVALVEGYNLQ